MPPNLFKRIGLGKFANTKGTAATKLSDARDSASLTFRCRGDSPYGEYRNRITHAQR
jgi:hypothetical protein